MAYDTDFAPGLIAQKNGTKGAALWVYKSADALSVVTVAGYFTDGDDIGMTVGDQVLVINTATGAASIHPVVKVTAGAAADIGGGTQELTASGAVTPGIREIQLNHASVIIAATVANADLHQGILILINTSASGTAAHTVTLTGGTWDGTNTIATLNAKDEMLIVFMDGAGNGRIIQNTGSVALS